MKHILKQGEISELLPENMAGGISGEAHLVKHEGKKYVLRKCKSIKKAKYYEFLASKFEKYGFLPKFLGRYGKNVLYEYIEGRDLRIKEKGKVIEQIGKIAAYVNKLGAEENYEKRFKRQLNELVTGKFKPTQKVIIRRFRDRLDIRRIKALFTNQQGKEILGLYEHLEKKAKPKTSLDANDIDPNNFRLRKGRVYFVDVEAIKPRVKGLGIAKAFIRWFKTSQSQRSFERGYRKIGKWFFEDEYADFCYLSFLIQTLNYKAQIGRDYKHDLKRLKNLMKRYRRR